MRLLEGWKTERLGVLIKDIGDGGTPNTNKKEYFDGSIPWVVIQDICKVISKTKTTLTPLGLKSCSAKLWPAGSVILSTGATIGEVGLTEVPVATKQGIHGIVCKEELSSHYLYYRLQTLREFLNANAQGSTIREVRANFLRTIPISFPISKLEQDKIAEILSTVDRAIEQTEALIAKQQLIKTGLMQDLLTRGIDEHGNLRSEKTHKFKDSPLGRIPVEWEIKTLDDCVRNDGPICYGILMPGIGFDNGVPVIKVKDISGGKILQNELLLTDPKIDDQYKRSRLRTGDLLLTIRGTTGRVALVQPELDKANITQDTARVRLTAEHSNQYFYFLLQGKRIQDQILLHTLGQAVKGINIAEVKKLSFSLPRIGEQEAIAERLNEIEKSLGSIDQGLNKLHTLKTALMQDLLTGKKRVTDLLSDGEE